MVSMMNKHLVCLFTLISLTNLFLFVHSQGTSVKIKKFQGEDDQVAQGSVLEIRGIVNKDASISFGECTKYSHDFDLAMYEQMCVFYHGMCKDLCLR